MKVVFLEDISNVARAGDVKEVKDGYARNYLIPKKLAALATPDQLQRVENLKKAAEARRRKETQDWQAIGEALEGTTVTIQMRTSSSGQLFGSVTNAIIAEELSRVIDREIDRRSIRLEEPIKELGTFQVPLRLHPGVEVTVNVVVEGREA